MKRIVKNSALLFVCTMMFASASVSSAQAQTNGQDAYTRGAKSKATGNISTAIGSEVTACKGNSTAFGLRTKAESENSFVVGRYNVIANRGDDCSETLLIDGDEPLFVVGNGTGPGGPISEQRRNALTVLKGGRTLLGTVGGVSTTRQYNSIVSIIGDAQITQDLVVGKYSFSEEKLPGTLFTVGNGRGVGGTIRDTQGNLRQNPDLPSNAFTVLADGRTVVGSVPDKPESITNTGATFSVNGDAKITQDLVVGATLSVAGPHTGKGHLKLQNTRGWAGDVTGIDFHHSRWTGHVGLQAYIRDEVLRDYPTKLHFGTASGFNNAVTRMTIDNSGNVGIGTVSPASKFEVKDGDIRVTNGSFIDDTVTMKDYVFEDDYSLMSLEELREFISREKHLPNVPSVKDVKKHGLNMSEFQMALLEKVEELTLYTLAQQKKIEELEARLDKK